MALVLLKTGIVHPGQPEAPPGTQAPFIDQAQMATAQKLLLFWRKPAVGPALNTFPVLPQPSRVQIASR